MTLPEAIERWRALSEKDRNGTVSRLRRDANRLRAYDVAAFMFAKQADAFVLAAELLEAVAKEQP